MEGKILKSLNSSVSYIHQILSILRHCRCLSKKGAINLEISDIHQFC